jgi:hypothetical protein
MVNIPGLKPYGTSAVDYRDPEVFCFSTPWLSTEMMDQVFDRFRRRLAIVPSTDVRPSGAWGQTATGVLRQAGIYHADSGIL